MRLSLKWICLLSIGSISLSAVAMDYRPENSRESKNVEDRRADQYRSTMKRCETSLSYAKEDHQNFLDADYSVKVDTTGGYTLTAASARSGLNSSRGRLSTHYERALRSAQRAYEDCSNVAADLGQSSSYDRLAKDLESKAISGMAEMINVRKRTTEKFEAASREIEEFGRGIANIQNHTK